jgi:hypothetical protein
MNRQFQFVDEKSEVGWEVFPWEGGGMIPRVDNLLALDRGCSQRMVDSG